jgi:hypothetical protein
LDESSDHGLGQRYPYFEAIFRDRALLFRKLVPLGDQRFRPRHV